MISTAMKVLMSTENEDATVVMNAMLVLFVADLVSGIRKRYIFFYTMLPRFLGAHHLSPHIVCSNITK